MFTIADQFGANDLREMAMKAWYEDVELALKSKAALRFVQVLWDMDNDGMDNFKNSVIDKAVQHPNELMGAPGFQEFLGRHSELRCS